MRVGRIALGRDASQFADAFLEFIDGDILPRSRPGETRDVFLKERAAVVVGAGEHGELRNFAAQLHPRNLDVIDGASKQHASQGVDSDVFCEGSSGACQSLFVQKRVVVNEAEGNELGEASGARLDVCAAAGCG